MVLRAACALDSADKQATKLCAMAKRYATDVCSEICNMALQIHGGYGYLERLSVRKTRKGFKGSSNLRGTNEIMRVIISRHLKAN